VTRRGLTRQPPNACVCDGARCRRDWSGLQGERGWRGARRRHTHSERPKRISPVCQEADQKCGSRIVPANRGTAGHAAGAAISHQLTLSRPRQYASHAPTTLITTRIGQARERQMTVAIRTALPGPSAINPVMAEMTAMGASSATQAAVAIANGQNLCCLVGDKPSSLTSNRISTA
jgi:hypothetical protein